jgi:hypothetical protein
LIDTHSLTRMSEAETYGNQVLSEDLRPQSKMHIASCIYKHTETHITVNISIPFSIATEFAVVFLRVGENILNTLNHLVGQERQPGS